MPQTIAVLIRLSDREHPPEAEPLMQAKRGDIWQAYVAPLPGLTALNTHYGYIEISGVPDNITLANLRHVITSPDYADLDGRTGLRNGG